MRDLGKLIVAKGLKKLPKVQKIAQSGHTAHKQLLCSKIRNSDWLDLILCLATRENKVFWKFCSQVAEEESAEEEADDDEVSVLFFSL